MPKLADHVDNVAHSVREVAREALYVAGWLPHKPAQDNDDTTRPKPSSPLLSGMSDALIGYRCALLPTSGRKAVYMAGDEGRVMSSWRTAHGTADAARDRLSEG